MPTKKIKSRKTGGNEKRLTNQQLDFVHGMLADKDYDGAAVAKRCGYKDPKQAAHRLLKNKTILAILGKAKHEREERCKLKADDVLQYLYSVLEINLLTLLKPTEDGWTIENPKDIPPEIGRLIENFEIVPITINGEIRNRISVKLISKTVALGLAMRHTTVDKVEVKHSWDQFLEAKPDDIIDVVGRRLLEEENKTKKGK